MPAGNYWKRVFGLKPGGAEGEVEGMQGMELLGENMAWLLGAVGKGSNPLPAREDKKFMHFIR